MKGHVAAAFWAFSSGVQAALLHNWAATGTPSWIPTETGTAKITSLNTGVSPKPTQAPGFVSEQDQVIELFRRQGVTDTTPWVNDQTCGWLASTSSRAILCGSEFTCATNSNEIVACVSGTFSPFFRVCMDYSAVQQGQCDNVGPETGCCNDRASPACATWIWTGKPARSQYGCAARSTTYSVMDIPQFILDSLTRSTSSSTRPTTIVSTKPTGTVTSASTTQTGAAQGGNTTTGGNTTVGTQTTTTTNLAPIIGGAVGGLVALVILVILVCCCMRKRRNKNSSTVNKTKTRNDTTVNYYNSQENQYNTNSNTVHEAKGSLGNDAMYERNLQAASNASGGSGGGGGGGVSAILCCARGRSGKKEKNGEKSGSVHSQHSGNGQGQHHHYYFDPNGNSGSAISNLTTARNSGDVAGPQTIRAVGGPPERSFSFQQQHQQQHQQQLYHTTGPASHSPYSMANAPPGQMLPMPTSFSHSPLGIMSNYPIPRHELESASVVAAQTPPSQTYHHHIQSQQHPSQLQPGMYQPPSENYYTSTGAQQLPHICNHHHQHSSPQGAPASLPAAAHMPPQYTAQPTTAMPTRVSAATSNGTGSGVPGDVSPQRLVAPSPMSSAASTIPSLHQQQPSIGTVDRVYHPLQPPPSARTSAANMLRFEDGAQQSQQMIQHTGGHGQQQHCSCCAANGHHHGMAQ